MTGATRYDNHWGRANERVSDFLDKLFSERPWLRGEILWAHDVRGELHLFCRQHPGAVVDKGPVVRLWQTGGFGEPDSPVHFHWLEPHIRNAAEGRLRRALRDAKNSLEWLLGAPLRWMAGNVVQADTPQARQSEAQGLVTHVEGMAQAALDAIERGEKR